MTKAFVEPAAVAFICETCGVEFPEAESPPATCPVCEDFRQYVGLDGQRWTTRAQLKHSYRNKLEEIAPGILSVHTDPKFAIGQRALVVRTPGFNILWDCVSLLDEPTIAAIHEFGGISAIAISHPHYYSTMIGWSEAFGGVPIFIHEDDRDWVMRTGECVRLWSGETRALSESLTLIRCGGHFEGAQVLHSADGALFTGDVIQVCPDRRWVSFMRSYPNYIPLPESAVRRIVNAIEPIRFDRLYGAWPKHEIVADAKQVVKRSAERYIRALTNVITG